jgi:hypothetical protein
MLLNLQGNMYDHLISEALLVLKKELHIHYRLAKILQLCESPYDSS